MSRDEEREAALLDHLLGEAEEGAAVDAEALAALEAEVGPVLGLLRRAGEAPMVDPPPELRVRTLAALAEARAGGGWIETLVEWLGSAPGVALAGALAAVLVAVVAGGRGGPEFVPGPDRGVRIAVARGPVTYRAYGDAAPLPFEPERDAGRAFREHESFVVPDGSRMALDWHGRGAIEVLGPADVIVREGGVKLVRGRLRSLVKPDASGFYVETDWATARVTGTVFTVETGPDGVEIEVEEGRVEVVPASEDGETVVLVEDGRWSYVPPVLPRTSADGVGAPSTFEGSHDPSGSSEDPEGADVGGDTEGSTAGEGSGGGSPDGSDAGGRGEPAGADAGGAPPGATTGPPPRASSGTGSGTSGPADVGEVLEEPIRPPDTIEQGF